MPTFPCIHCNKQVAGNCKKCPHCGGTYYTPAPGDTDPAFNLVETVGLVSLFLFIIGIISWVVLDASGWLKVVGLQ